jgi:DNA primase
VLYGLDMARPGIRTADEAVIVEGYMDVLMAHQHGINNVVAQMGTALTESQLGMLKKQSQRFVLALDADAAGNRATLRGLDVARQVMDREVVPVPTPRGLIRFEDRLAAEIRIATLPEGLDPDEVIRESPARWAQIIGAARPVLDYYFDVLTEDLDLATAKGKSEAVSRLGPLVAELGDQVQRNHYLQQLARMVQMDDRALWQQIASAQSQGRGQPTRSPRRTDREEAATRIDISAHCLSLLLTYPELISEVDAAFTAANEEVLRVEDLQRPEDRAILTAWRAWIGNGGSRNPRAEFYDDLDESLQARIDALLAAQKSRPEVADEVLRNDLLDTVMRLRIRNRQREIRDMRFLLEDDRSSETATLYGPRITDTTMRIRRLEQAIRDRSLSGRRQHHDEAVRVPFGAG